MATKEQPQPTNVAQPEMPMQPNAYQAYPPQYAYEDPNKGKAKMLTLEYALAMGSAIISIMLLIDIITKVFGLWTNSTSMLLRSVGGFFAPSMVTQGTGIIAASVFAVLLAVLSLVLFSRQSTTSWLFEPAYNKHQRIRLTIQPKAQQTLTPQ
jgi:hypothetical protein